MILLALHFDAKREDPIYSNLQQLFLDPKGLLVSIRFQWQ